MNVILCVIIIYALYGFMIISVLSMIVVCLGVNLVGDFFVLVIVFMFIFLME